MSRRKVAPRESTLLAAAQRMAEAMTRDGRTVATAESCTGGLVGACITSVPGSSAFYVGGVVTYANAAKVRLLGVSETNLRLHGAVSPQVAAEMADGVRERTGADLALSVTGIAGPGGGTADKPVGLVYLGVSSANATTVVRLDLHGDRAAIRRWAAYEALDMLLSLTRGLPPRRLPARVEPVVAQDGRREPEPIVRPPPGAEVEARFEGRDKIVPQAFRWGGTEHRVAQIGGTRQEGARFVFTVITQESRMFELTYDKAELAWHIKPVGPVAL